MSHTVLDILILLFGCALFMVVLIAALTYREMRLKKFTSEQDFKDFVAMRLYKEHWNAERERKSEVKTDPNEPKFGQGWFPYTVRRDLEEVKRKQGLKNNDKTS